MQVAVQMPGISVEAAATAVQAAVAYAEANGWKINAAVVDRGGNLMAFLRIPPFDRDRHRQGLYGGELRLLDQELDAGDRER